MDPSRKKIKVEPSCAGSDGGGGGGGGAAGGGSEGGSGGGTGSGDGGGSGGGDRVDGGGGHSDASGGSGGNEGGRRSGGDRRELRTGTDTPPSDLVQVGKILSVPQRRNPTTGGIAIKVHVETWMPDLYRTRTCWIELPNVEDVMASTRGQRVKVKAMPLGWPHGETALSSSIGMANETQGRVLLEGIEFGLLDQDNGGLGMLSGTPPRWFQEIWGYASSRSGPEGTSIWRPSGRLAKEFRGAKVYVTHTQALHEQRDWLN